MYYVLDGRTPRRVEVREWGYWFQTADRTVAKTKFMKLREEIKVSTVFLGLDHAFGISAVPALFETLVFGGDHDGDMWRYATWQQAELGHESICKRLQSLGWEEDNGSLPEVPGVRVIRFRKMMVKNVV